MTPSRPLRVSATQEEGVAAGDLALYTLLFQRYDSNTDLQWRVPATVMTVESFVYLALVTIGEHHYPAKWTLASIGALLAWIGAASMRRIEQTALADRALLDIYEAKLAVRLPVLPHTMRFPDRLATLRQLQGGEGAPADGRMPTGIIWASSKTSKLGRLLFRVDKQFLRFPPSLTWFVLLVVTGAGALLMPALLARS